MNRSLLLLIIFFCISCSQRNETKIIDYKEFQIEVPNNWKKLKLKGIDSNIGGLITTNNDTLIFDLGRYSNELDVYAELRDSIIGKIISDEKNPKKRAQMITSSIEFGLLDSINLKSLLKYNVEFKIIDNKNAKIIYPKNNLTGTTGIYIEKADNKDSTISFNFYGTIKDSLIQKQFLQSLHSLKFKD